MNLSTTLLDNAQKTFGGFPSQPGVSAELFLTQAQIRGITWADGKLDMENQANQRGLTIRLLKSGKQAMASTQGFSPSQALAAWSSAFEALEFSQADPAITFPGKVTAKAGRPGLDTEIFQKRGDQVKDTLKGLEVRIKARDRRLSKVIRIGFSEAFQEWALVNSNGASISERSTESSFLLEALAEDNGRSETAGRYQATRFGRDLAPDHLIDVVCEEVLESLGAGPMPSGNNPIVFDPWVGCQFLELVAHGLCADQVQKGKSFFGRPRGQTVGSALVTLIDDGLMEKGLASSAYDDEGTPRQKTIPVEGGRLQALLYDATSGARDRAASTGNGTRASFSRPPAPSPSNFFMSPGSISPESLIQGTRRGFLVQEVMGMHTADPISGDFSVGAQGRWIEGGRLSKGVRGVTLAGNLKKLLEDIDAVASDLTWYGAIGTPTFRVAQLTIGGT
jgi:PmbA protein